jgi:hypothetical protein
VHCNARVEFLYLALSAARTFAAYLFSCLPADAFIFYHIMIQHFAVPLEFAHPYYDRGVTEVSSYFVQNRPWFTQIHVYVFVILAWRGQ